MKANKIKNGDLVAFTYYGKVVGHSAGELSVYDVDNKREFLVRGTDLIEGSLSADQFSSTKKVNKTKAAEVLIEAKNRPLTVMFTKVNGEDRKLRGRLVNAEPLLGRSMVQDLDITKGNPLRQVDHRTIKWLIVDDVKYEVKK